MENRSVFVGGSTTTTSQETLHLLLGSVPSKHLRHHHLSFILSTISVDNKSRKWQKHYLMHQSTWNLALVIAGTCTTYVSTCRDFLEHQLSYLTLFIRFHPALTKIASAFPQKTKWQRIKSTKKQCIGIFTSALIQQHSIMGEGPSRSLTANLT